MTHVRPCLELDEAPLLVLSRALRSRSELTAAAGGQLRGEEAAAGGQLSGDEAAGAAASAVGRTVRRDRLRERAI